MQATDELSCRWIEDVKSSFSRRVTVGLSD
jgi:hypothetical protein